MKNLRSQKLVQYTALSTAFLIAHQANGQSYHEFDPYLPLTNANDVFIDIDDDGIDDFSFYFAKDWVGSSSSYGGEIFNFFAQQFGDIAVMATILPSVEFYSSIDLVYCTLPETFGVMRLDENVAINETALWEKAEIMARVDQCGFSGAFGFQGEWQLDNTTRDYFVAFKIANPDIHFGWMRLRHNEYYKVDYVKDFYIEPGIATETATPDLFNHVAPAANNLNLYYNVDGKLILEFDAAAHEDSLQEYRIILRNAIYTAALTATKCEITLPEFYVAVPKTGEAHYTVDISNLSADWTGDNLNIGDNMRAYVYSKFNFPVTLLNGLAPKSNEIEKLDTVDVANQNIPAPELQIWTANNLLYINLNSAQINEITLLDLSGRIIINQVLVDNHCTIKLPELVTGIYMVQVTTPQGIFTQKLFLN